jgi:cell wall-associated NlpC family hydrolase
MARALRAMRSLQDVRLRVAGKGRIVAGAAAVLVVAGVAVLVRGAGGGRVADRIAQVASGSQAGEDVNLDPAAIARDRSKSKSASAPAGSARPQLVVAVPPGTASEQPTSAPRGGGARAETDAQIERDLAQFRKYLATIPPATGKRAAVISTGEAAAPFDAPPIVIEVVQAANQIALTPYRWGGGHGAWRDKGYDCSGSVSFALAAAGLLNQPLDSTRFMSYGAPGKGKWITIYANAGHAWMTVAGLRFDTGGLRSGTRWQASMRPTSGFVVRHPPGF